jgi:PhnB protein
MNVQTTLNFYGRTEEAVRFYGRTIEAETLFLMRFRDCPDPSQLGPGMEEKIFCSVETFLNGYLFDTSKVA